MKFDPEEDARVFGVGAWVYCNQHMRPHLTGWCTVSPRNKTKLDATNDKAAYEECRLKRFELFGESSAPEAKP